MIEKLVPALKNYVWGGRKLNTLWNKRADFPVAESWELSREDIPLLIKLIDAESDLSVQVHPTDEFARIHEDAPCGKTEAWHVLDAEKGSVIYLGLRKSVTREQLQKSISNGTVLRLLNKIEVQRGQTYLVPSGQLHAIGKGVTVYEIQQNCNITYRAYDYGRLGADGKPRQLHVDKVLACANLDKLEIPPQNDGNLLVKCRYFSLYRNSGATHFTYPSFCAVTVIDGEITLNGMHLIKGETALVSAGEQVEVGGGGEYLIATV